MRPNIEKIRERLTSYRWHDNLDSIFVGQYVQDVTNLFDYIDDLENMPLVQRLIEQSNELEFLRKLKDLPLVQTVIERDREIEQLNEVIKDRTNDVIHYDSENKKLQEENERLKKDHGILLNELVDQFNFNGYQSMADALSKVLGKEVAWPFRLEDDRS